MLADTAVAKIFISDIQIEGNIKTKDEVILRQLTFVKGDSISTQFLMEELKRSQQNLVNLGLFSIASVNIGLWEGNQVEIKISVKERWFTYPGLTLDLADRNFNTWYDDHHHDWNRIQYGMRFYQYNVRGRNESLKLIALLGYSKRFEAGYNIPFFDKKQQLGCKFNLVYTEDKMVNYITSGNKEMVYQNFDNVSKKNFSTQLDFFRKPGFNYSQRLGFDFVSNQISDTIAQLNPDYYLNGNTTQKYLAIRFTYIADFRDMKYYPLKGNYLEWFISKQGLGLFDEVNILTTTLTFNQYYPLAKNWYVAFGTRLKYSWPSHQPYNIQRGLGYQSDYVSGYELYIIDGQQFAIQKANVKFHMLQFQVKTNDKNIFTKGAPIPIGFFLRGFIDGGYVVDEYELPTNFLANQTLLGYGLAFDLVTFYDSSIRFEYSFNRQGENGLYLHMSSTF